jgi:hypothetical protein
VLDLGHRQVLQPLAGAPRLFLAGVAEGSSVHGLTVPH